MLDTPNEKSSYPGGKSGSGIYQRLINLIPRHRILVVPFAGHCGIVRNIQPAEHTIVVDQDPKVCEWWASWRRSKRGRDLEIHNCDGIEFIRYRFGVTEYFDAGARDAGSNDSRSRVTGSQKTRPVMTNDFGTMSQNSALSAGDAFDSDTAATRKVASEAFFFCDPPYVLSKRSSGRIYEFEMSDADHLRCTSTLTRLDATRYHVMICGYESDLYASLESWNAIAHRVPTRGGLQDEMIWMNYERPVFLHDYRFIGDGRRSRERIRRRQINWREQLLAMSQQERSAMLEVLNGVQHGT